MPQQSLAISFLTTILLLSFIKFLAHYLFIFDFLLKICTHHKNTTFFYYIEPLTAKKDNRNNLQSPYFDLFFLFSISFLIIGTPFSLIAFFTLGLFSSFAIFVIFDMGRTSYYQHKTNISDSLVSITKKTVHVLPDPNRLQQTIMQHPCFSNMLKINKKKSIFKQSGSFQIDIMPCKTN